MGLFVFRLASSCTYRRQRKSREQPLPSHSWTIGRPHRDNFGINTMQWSTGQRSRYTTDFHRHLLLNFDAIQISVFFFVSMQLGTDVSLTLSCSVLFCRSQQMRSRCCGFKRGWRNGFLWTCWTDYAQSSTRIVFFLMITLTSCSLSDDHGSSSLSLSHSLAVL